MEPVRYDLRHCDGDSGRCRAEMEESEDGDYMSYESYAAQVAEIERLTADVEFWKSAAEAQRRKNCDECVRIAQNEDNGTGKVHPSVEGEIVVKDSADQYGQIHISGLETGTTYRVIVQKVGEKP